MVMQDRARTGLKALPEEYAQRFAPASQSAFFTALKQLTDAQAKRAPMPQSSGLFVVPKR
jgi:hypothetical protein